MSICSFFFNDTATNEIYTLSLHDALPILKPDQVAYILKDCKVRVLVTSVERLRLLAPILAECHDLHAVIVVGGKTEPVVGPDIVAWEDALSHAGQLEPHRAIDTDMAAILYTS